MGDNQDSDALEKPGLEGPSESKDIALSEKDDGHELKTDHSDNSSLSTEHTRETWTSGIEFILSCVGFAVGLGNVWRFPYLCYKNGGGAFLIPYFICLVCGGVPVFFLEVALGQFMSEGGVGVWKICPLMQGIGYGTTVIVFLMNIYYIIILAWDVFFLYESFTSVLPWSHCNNTWNTERCTLSFIDRNLTNCTSNGTVMVGNIILCNDSLPSLNYTPVDPVVEFWEKRILQISDSVEEVGGVVWQLALALAIVWVVVYFCIWKGVKWTGKVVYFTATFPYIVITALLIRGVTLDGAIDGIKFYLYPEFSKLGEAQVWIDAGTQIFFSYAIGLGAMTALGSYNKFNNNCYRDCVIISCINSGTSLYAGFAIFSVLGFMAKEQGLPITEVAEKGPGLAFIAYPKAVTQMPIAPLWAVLFFLMIIFLGLDSQFVGVEAFITAMLDMFPNFLRKGHNREIFSAIYCAVSFLIGLCMVTNGGMYVFQLFDYYSASGMTLLWICFFECITVAWIYGGGRFYDNIEMMIGYRINRWLQICWTVLGPIITAGIFIFMWVQFEPLTYNKIYTYPGYAQGLGMCMAFASMICVPLNAIFVFIRADGSLRQRWQTITSPNLKPHQKLNVFSNDPSVASVYSSYDTYVAVPSTEKPPLNDFASNV